MQSLRISRCCIWPLVYSLCFFPWWRREQQCLLRDFRSWALWLTREKRDWCWRACCRQHFQSNHSLLCPSCNIWKGSPQIWSHLGARWLVKHLLVRSLQSDFDWRWKSHLNPCHYWLTVLFPFSEVKSFHQSDSTLHAEVAVVTGFWCLCACVT